VNPENTLPGENQPSELRKSSDLPMIGLMVVLAAVLVWVVSGTLEPKVTSAGDIAPNFEIKTESGKVLTRKDFGGKVLVLNFWASWCEPCVIEAPSLNAMYKTLGKDGVVVVGVSLDTNEKRYKQFIQSFGLTYPIGRDPESNISASYGTFQIPETYIIDSSGKVREKIISNQDFMDPKFLERVKSYL
jgi:peroxiredoxin